MRPPGTPFDDGAPPGAGEPAIDEGKVRAALAELRCDLTSGEVPDAELLRRIEAFADLFLPPAEPPTS